MEQKRYICDGTTFAYMKGYIVLPLAVGPLPESILVGDVVLHKKSGFHVSLLNVGAILREHPGLERDILDFFCAYTKENDISFVRYTGKFRYVEDEEKKTVIALCEMKNLKTFSDALGKELGFDIPPQPAHVTLFTLQKDAGIGLNSPADMENKSIATDVSDEVRSGLGLS